MTISQTYSSDAQITDSASASTAMLGGTKSNFGTVGVGPGVQVGDCASAAGREVMSILEESKLAGRWQQQSMAWSIAALVLYRMHVIMILVL